MEEVWNVPQGRCESLSNNQPIMAFGAKELIMKLYDEMPTHVLAEYKAMGDFTVL